MADWSFSTAEIDSVSEAVRAKQAITEETSAGVGFSPLSVQKLSHRK